MYRMLARNIQNCRYLNAKTGIVNLGELVREKINIVNNGIYKWTRLSVILVLNNI